MAMSTKSFIHLNNVLAVTEWQFSNYRRKDRKESESQHGPIVEWTRARVWRRDQQHIWQDSYCPVPAYGLAAVSLNPEGMYYPDGLDHHRHAVSMTVVS